MPAHTYELTRVTYHFKTKKLHNITTNPQKCKCNAYIYFVIQQFLQWLFENIVKH